MKLLPLQSDFQEYLLDRPSGILKAVRGNSRVDAKAMMGVYHHAYKARLIECLANDYPCLQGFLGEDKFASMAAAYISRHPSSTPSVRWLGRFLPAFLSRTEPYAQQPILGDLATFEWELAFAFDAIDAPHVTFQDMIALPPESWSSLRLSFHPSLREITLSTNAPLLRERINQEESWEDLDCSPRHQTRWLVWRKELDAHYRALEEDEQECFTLMKKGACFAEMCDALIPFVGEERAALRAAEILRGWLEWAMITDMDADVASSAA